MLIICLLSVHITLFSQTKAVTGTVYNASGEPLSGATISLKNSGSATSTNANGKFSIKAPPDGILVISSMGFASTELKVGEQTDLRIVLNTSVDPLDNVVVVAYGRQKVKDLTGSVAVVNVDNAKKTASYDIAKMLQGQVAGVTVHGSGEPGGYVQLKIRGVTTFGNNAPLFVIDGVPMDAPFDFSPDDVESMQILKDASSAALYGARAATGVVIITTKKGKKGPIKIDYNGYYGWQKIPKTLPVTDREGYQKITSAAEINAGLTVAPANDPASPNFSTINTNWQDALFQTGKIQDHHINLSGGGDNINYSLGLGYFDQTSTMVGPQSYKRFTLNNAFSGKRGIFSYGGKVAYTQSDKVNLAITGDHAVFGGGVTSMLTAIPTMPIYDENRLGGYGGSDELLNRAIALNVIGMNNLVTDNSDRNRFFGNVWGEIEIVKGLRYKLNLSYDYTNYKNYHFEPKFDLGFYYLNNNYILSDNRGNGYTGLVENLLTYNVVTGKHNIDFLAGTTYQEGHGEWTTGRATGNGDYETYNFSALPSEDKVLLGESSTSTILSFLGRVNYNYDSRYMLTVNFRRDGSSRFGPANRYGNFPSVSAAWNISNEKFIHLPAVISNLKIRGGYGTLGNQNFGDYLFQSYINPNASYNFGDVLAQGSAVVYVADPNLRWESTKTGNVAIDLGFFSNQLTFSAEYFNRESYDIITSLPLPYSAGSFPANITTNAASMRNKGLEFTLNYQHQTSKDFHYAIGANLGTLQNKVLKLGLYDNPIYGSGSKTEVGREIGELFGFVTEGIFQNQEDLDKHAKQTNAAVGDMMFKDTNGRDAEGKLTGQPDGLITDDDRVYLGSTIPSFNYGFNLSLGYKQFDFSFFFQGQGGNKVNNGVYGSLMSTDYGNHHQDVLNFWTPQNTNTNIPRPVKGDPNGNGRFSDRFVESGAYGRLQNAVLGYTFSPQLLARTKVLKSFRAYVSGQNLFTISNYKGYDPDFISDGLFSRGFDYGSFPNPRTIMVGLQVGF
ncbi:putative TonB-dependent receptor [Flavihumibacter petaseus NBRC 106054]|uniref:Putative TonB-dependent receptor n=1 Tax=Flavihumibacter petaseus NBRC 106054 TaxID=1220578 RepID=A0A0E9N221_9BACT|nr:putative TonB-dependent receptor [Flavihumibacter petaseus NBRC 106054]